VSCQPRTRSAERFYVTADGGRTWHDETVTRRLGTRDQATYVIPAPTGPAPGILAVTFGGTAPAQL
jgi:hypothetical protein